MIILTDIDDTLMKTKRKIKDLDICTIGAYSKTGEVLSYIDPFRQEFIDSFITKHLFIPVTARSFASLKNVQLDFKNEKVINFGAHILDADNNFNQEWSDKIASQQKSLNILEKVDFIRANFALPESVKIIERMEYDTFVFFNYRNSNLSMEENIIFGQRLTQFLKDNDLNDFYLYTTDRDVTLIPNYIKKEFAVEFLLKKYQDITSIGIGDHKNDFSFMHLCNFSLFPNDSSIAKLLKEFK